MYTPCLTRSKQSAAFLVIWNPGSLRKQIERVYYLWGAPLDHGLILVKQEGFFAKFHMPGCLLTDGQIGFNRMDANFERHDAGVYMGQHPRNGGSWLGDSIGRAPGRELPAGDAPSPQPLSLFGNVSILENFYVPKFFFFCNFGIFF